MLAVAHEVRRDRAVVEPFPSKARGAWYVLHVRSRMEKILAGEMRLLDIGCFLPLVRQVRYYGKRKALVEQPLFPGYLFLRGSIEDVYRADRTRRVARIIPVNDQAGVNWELQNIHLALIKEAPLDPYPALRRGVRVEVRSGPFRGLQGVVERRMGENRLVLQINMLGRAVSLEVDAALLDPI